MVQRTNITTVMYVIEIIIIAVAAMLLAGGIATTEVTGYKVGPYAPFGGGLTAIAVAATALVGAGAMHFHRRHMENSEELKLDNAQLRGELRELRAELTETRRDVRACLVLLKDRREAEGDELAGRRHAGSSST